MSQRRIRFWLAGVHSGDVETYAALTALATERWAELIGMDLLQMRTLRSFLGPPGPDLTYWDRRCMLSRRMLDLLSALSSE